MSRRTSPTANIDLTDEELLTLYLSLPKKQREERFIDTAHAANTTGLAVRTIQSWIESGAIRAVIIGRKYRVDLYSLMEYLRGQMDKQRR